MTVRSVDHLLAELRELLQAQYEQGKRDALKRILGAARESPNRTHRVIPKGKTQVRAR